MPIDITTLRQGSPLEDCRIAEVDKQYGTSYIGEVVDCLSDRYFVIDPTGETCNQRYVPREGTQRRGCGFYVSSFTNQTRNSNCTAELLI